MPRVYFEPVPADAGSGNANRPESEQSNQSDGDQIYRHDEVQKFGHQQNQDARDKGDQGSQTKVNVHTEINAMKVEKSLILAANAPKTMDLILR